MVGKLDALDALVKSKTIGYCGIMVTGSDPITSGDLRKALGWSVATFWRALKAGKVPTPTASTPGGHARWTVAVAAEALRAWGRPVPAEWGWTEQEAA